VRDVEAFMLEALLCEDDPGQLKQQQSSAPLAEDRRAGGVVPTCAGAHSMACMSSHVKVSSGEGTREGSTCGGAGRGMQAGSRSSQLEVRAGKVSEASTRAWQMRGGQVREEGRRRLDRARHADHLAARATTQGGQKSVQYQVPKSPSTSHCPSSSSSSSSSFHPPLPPPSKHLEAG